MPPMASTPRTSCDPNSFWTPIHLPPPPLPAPSTSRTPDTSNALRHVACADVFVVLLCRWKLQRPMRSLQVARPVRPSASPILTRSRGRGWACARALTPRREAVACWRRHMPCSAHILLRWVRPSAIVGR